MLYYLAENQDIQYYINTEDAELNIMHYKLLHYYYFHIASYLL